MRATTPARTPARPFARLPLRAAAALALAAALLVPGGDARAADGPPAGVDPKSWKEWNAVIDRFFAAEGDGGRLLVEGEAAKLPPLPPEAVAPLAERIFDLAGKTGPKLKKSGSDFFHDRKAKVGLYMVAPATKKPCGLLIAMHGGGEGQGDAGSAFGIWSGATSNGMTVIAPEVMKKVSSAWNEEKEEEFVLELIDAAKRTFPVDPERIYLAGHSMGGDGSWMIGGRNADLFAAAAPLAGSVMPYMRQGKLNRLETPLSDYLGLMEGVLPNLMHVPYWIAHSSDDRNEAIHPDDIAVGRLKEMQKLFPGRYEHVYDRIDGNGHALPPKGVGPILEWMEKKKRVTYPAEVVWETWWPWKRQMHWLYHPEPDDAWRFHAKVTGENTVEVRGTTKPVQGRSEPKELELTILCSPRMFDLSKPLRVLADGKTIHDGPVPRTLWTLLVTAGRRNDRSMWFEGAVTVKLPRTRWHEGWEPPPAATTESGR